MYRGDSVLLIVSMELCLKFGSGIDTSGVPSNLEKKSYALIN